MVDRIIDFSARHRGLVISVALGAALWGWQALKRIPLDAVPDLSDVQVIVSSHWDRSPDIIEDQVTYPIVTALLGAPHVRTVRGISDFGSSYVYVLFDDDTDLYWARSRTLEYLSSVLPQLPAEVRTQLGPDATGLGWVFQYVLTDSTGRRNPAELRSIQEWYVRYHLRAVPGVSEVASVGGFLPEFQISLDPLRLRSYGISTSQVVRAVRQGNVETGGRLLEFGGSEYMIRGRGYAKSRQDIEELAVGNGQDGAAVRVKDLGKVSLGPSLRRGVADLDGRGETVSGIVIMRQGQNALSVINSVKTKIAEIAPGLPAGVKIAPVYDRSDLILRAVANLRSTLIEVIFAVVLIIALFLWHFPSAVVPVITIPATILIAFLSFGPLGISLNIMSLGGIAIAAGALVDAAIVAMEQTHKRLEEWQQSANPEHTREIVIAAMKEVTGPAFFALLVTAAAFIPVLTLEGQEGRLFRPLAYAKCMTMVVAAILAITLVPALRVALASGKRPTRGPAWLRRAADLAFAGRIHSEDRHPISRVLIRLYAPVVSQTLRHKWVVFGAVVLLAIVTLPILPRIGTEFMPPLDEGVLLYMPSTLPGISISESKHLLQVTDRILKGFPEVQQVLGKAGRADTATDPAPLSMLETLVILKPQDQWRRVHRWYSDWAPGFLSAALRRIQPDHISTDQLTAEMDAALAIPGVSNSWTMPVRGRIDMLTTGIRSPIGIKISGGNLETIQQLGNRAQELLKPLPGTRSVFAEHAAEGYYMDIDWNRAELARQGISMEDAQAAVRNSIGGEDVTTIIRGRERYPVNVRFQRDFRSDIESLRRLLVSSENGERQVALGQLASVKMVRGPSMIRDENGLLTGYVYVDLSGRDPSSYIQEASRLFADKLKIPPGFSISWSGQYEGYQRMSNRLRTVIPLTLGIILVLLYLNTRSAIKTGILLLAVPFSAIGAIWAVYLLGYHMSPAVWVGLIALLGVDAETGVFMLLYLDLALERARIEGRLRNLADLQAAILAGAARRIRPKLMTAAAMFFGLIPIMWSAGTGSEVMKRIAAPMLGGILVSWLLELLVYPPLYELAIRRAWRLRDRGGETGWAAATAMHEITV